jgi:two-component system, NtrC family, sensor kinase
MVPFFRLSTRLHRLLIAAGLFVPALLFAGAAWKSRMDILREGETTLVNAVSVLADSVRDQLQIEELALGSVEEHLRGLDWSAIERPDTSDFLVRLKASLDQVSAIWIADRDGTVRAASKVWPPGARISDHALFQVEGHNDLYVSAMFAGVPGQPVALAVIRRHLAPDGKSDGTIHAEMDPRFFAHLFAEVPLPAHDAVLVGANGTVLAAASDLQGEMQQSDATDPLTGHIAAQPLRGEFFGRSVTGDRKQEVYSYEQVPGYPVWISVAVDREAILARWYDSLEVYGSAAAAASVALLIASWVAIRRAKAEQATFTLLHAESERRLDAERRLRETHRLEVVAQLAGGIAHDFNNLLSVVMGSLELIEITMGPPDRIQTLIARAKHAIERGARLTSSLLTFARRQMIQTDTLDVNGLISNFLPVIQQSVGETIRLELRLQPDLRPCRADAAHLEAALLNVAINARDAMQNGGTLTIATRDAQLGRAELADTPEVVPGTFVAVSVTDTGTGMPQEVQAKAFEPYFTTKEVGKGSGLGLSQVLGFVRQLGGNVTIESAVGRGSVVTLFLPRDAGR